MRRPRKCGQAVARVVDLLYPPACPACHGRVIREADTLVQSTEPVFPSPPELFFCDSCRAGLRRMTGPSCHICGELFPSGDTSSFRCPNCHDRTFAFEFAVSAFENTGPVRELVHRFKYGGQLYLRSSLAALLATGLGSPRLRGELEEVPPWILVPVPLFRTRRRERGFNQAEELARRVSTATGLDWHSALWRTRPTTPQARLDRSERLANLKGAFALRKGAHVLGKKILLIDDVFTTGATADACARILTRDGGAEKVVPLTIARG